MAFATIAFAELHFVFSCRSWRLPPWRLPPNSWLFAAVVASAAVAFAAIYVPALHGPLDTVALTVGQLGVVLGLAVVPVKLRSRCGRRSHDTGRLDLWN
jgi:magnesium-transporting ATPase (P-type)